MKRIFTKYLAVLFALAVSTLPMFLCPAVAQAQNVARVNGGGGALVTMPDGAVLPVHFGLSGIVLTDGTAKGHVNFVFPPPFGDMFGVGLIHIQGRVTSGAVDADGTIILEGTLTERDYIQGQGVVFLEENVPFRIEVGGSLAARTLLLQWCLLPVFPVEVTNGNLTLQ
jgi:hypothetical protein